MMPTAVFPAANAIRAGAVVGVQQRSFGLFSSIRENVSDKMEEKKKKTAGLEWTRISHQ